MTRRVFIAPLQTLNPVFTFGGVPFPLHGEPGQCAHDAPDEWAYTEWLGGLPQTTQRLRTEVRVPVPLMTCSDWADLDALLGGAR